MGINWRGDLCVTQEFIILSVDCRTYVNRVIPTTDGDRVKRVTNSSERQVVSGSWDKTVRVWDVEKEDWIYSAPVKYSNGGKIACTTA